MSDRGTCPSCGAPVESWVPVIKVGREHYDGVITEVEPDKLVGFDLRPCGHRCDHVEWTSASGHRFFNGTMR